MGEFKYNKSQIYDFQLVFGLVVTKYNNNVPCKTEIACTPYWIHNSDVHFKLKLYKYRGMDM